MSSSQSSQVIFVEANKLRKNDLVLLRDKVARVKDLRVSVQGKHGSAKVVIVAYGIDKHQKRIEQTFGSHEHVTAPVPVRYDADVIAVNGSTVTVFDTATKSTHDRLELDDDVDLHRDIAERVANGEELVLDVLAVHGTEKIVSIRRRKADE
jgi:translation elongation factor P/translation initiation factor 5A